MLVVDAAQPDGALIEIGLITAGVAVRALLAAVLDAGISAGAAGDAELDGEIEVVHLAVPEDPLVALELLVGGDFSGDGAVFDTPVLRLTGPMIERLAIENRFSVEQRRGQQKGTEEFHGG